MLCEYQCGDFSQAETIAVLCRGSSLSYLPRISDKFSYGYIVNNFRQSLARLGSCLSGKKIVRVMNKLDTQTHRKTFAKFGIEDIQCNFDGWLDRPVPEHRLAIKKEIERKNPWCKVHLAPPGLREARPRNANEEPIGWSTTGLFSLDLACFWKPKKIIVLGMDFYYSNYYQTERKKEASIGQNRKHATEMIENFNAIVARDSDIKFVMVTACPLIKPKANLEVINHGKRVC